MWINRCQAISSVDRNDVITVDEKNDRRERDLWHIMFLQMSRIVWMLRLGHATSHCPSAWREKFPLFRSLVSTACARTRLSVDLLVQEHALLVPSMNDLFESVFMSVCACMYTHLAFSLSFSWSDQHVQGRVFYSNQFHYRIDILTFLYWRWSSTNTAEKKRERSRVCCIKR